MELILLFPRFFNRAAAGRRLPWPRILRKMNAAMPEFPGPDSTPLQKTLLDKRTSTFRKYVRLFVGKKGAWAFLKYEIIMAFFSPIPGALGFFLRRLFFPLLFKRVGRGVAFGRCLTVRHPHKISIGSHAYIDDFAVLDAKGEDNDGIRLGDNVFIGRGTILSCKEGSIDLEDFVNISANCSLYSETEIKIGKYSLLAGHCYLVAGGNHTFEDTDVPIMFQPAVNKGGIHIGEGCWLGASVTVVDGVKLGKGCIAGAGSVVAKSFPDFSIALGNPAVRIKSRVS